VLHRKKEVRKESISLWETTKANARALCSSQPKTQEQIKSRYESMLKTLKDERLAAKQVIHMYHLIGGEIDKREGNNKLHNRSNNICSLCNTLYLSNTSPTNNK
jgi:hypothetical protein